ncbi:MAG TPA: nicotinate-nucleotide diphosphorylase (carboxylating), partial [Chloroflexi bacterium]|nr:nicotinate-nucleotide diphosphorylase (carboxylating) [Chloroflexota bacterium]
MSLHPEILAAIRRALEEDLGSRGDATSDSIIPPEAEITARIVAKQDGIVAGLDVAAAVFREMNVAIRCIPRVEEGQSVRSGDLLAEVGGPARAVLAAERTAL